MAAGSSEPQTEETISLTLHRELVRRAEEAAYNRAIQDMHRMLGTLRPTNNTFLDDSIEALNLGTRANNALRHIGVATLGELTQKTEKDILDINYVGIGALNEIKRALQQRGLSLRVY